MTGNNDDKVNLVTRQLFCNNLKHNRDWWHLNMILLKSFIEELELKYLIRIEALGAVKISCHFKMDIYGSSDYDTTINDN